MNINLSDYKSLYLKTARDHLQKIKEAITAGNIADIRLHAHSLKNSSSVINFQQIAKISGLIEQYSLASPAGKNINPNVFSTISEVVETLSKALDSIEKTNKEPDLTATIKQLADIYNPT